MQVKTQSQPLRLLIVEDVPTDVELICMTLDAAGICYTYDVADTVARCRGLLSQNDYDLVLSDFRLPAFTGVEAFECLQQSGQEVPFVLVTGSLGEEAAVECIKAGMTDYVLKDRLFRLPSVLQRALQEFELRWQQRAAIAQLRQQARRDAIVNQIVQAMRETLELEAIFQTTVDQLHEVLNAEACSILQPHPESAQLQIQYVSAATPNREDLVGQTYPYAKVQPPLLPPEQIVVLQAAELANIVWDQSSAPPQSVLWVPLSDQRQYLGGISVHQCDRDRTWTDHDIALVQAVANQCAIAIQQAQLYQQAQVELAERQKIEAQLRHDAFHDALTGLPNRTLLLERLQHLLHMARRRYRQGLSAENIQFAVLFLDLDRFKVINDSLGHSVGDRLLQEVAQRLSHCLRDSDTVARLGGDEFVALLEDINGPGDAIDVVHRIQAAFAEPILLEQHEIFSSTSVGIALSAPHYIRPSQLLRDADAAMYRAKKKGRGSYELFDSSMHTQALKQLQGETELRRAMKQQELQLYYQPIFNLQTHEIIGFEALLRWQHPEKGLISPQEFIPLAEETGLIKSLDLWVVEVACQQLQQWQTLCPKHPGLCMNVNLSGQHFSSLDLIGQLERILSTLGLKTERLRLEITESVLIDNTQIAARLLQDLKQRQIQLCLDDFGTGYSSLSYLHQFPIDVLKIDQSFVAQLEGNSNKSEIVRAIATLGTNLGMMVVAEGVETSAQADFLRRIGCLGAQGYYFAAPLPEAEATALLQ